MTGRIVPFGPGFWAPVFDPPFSLVGTFLTQDVQRCVASCDHYLGEAVGVASGTRKIVEIQGNGHVVRIVPERVSIRNIHDAELQPVSLSMDAFVGVLTYWKSIVVAWDRKSPPTLAPLFFCDDPT